MQPRKIKPINEIKNFINESDVPNQAKEMMERMIDQIQIKKREILADRLSQIDYKPFTKTLTEIIENEEHSYWLSEEGTECIRVVTFKRPEVKLNDDKIFNSGDVKIDIEYELGYY